jgi:hypothetical protein
MVPTDDAPSSQDLRAITTIVSTPANPLHSTMAGKSVSARFAVLCNLIATSPIIM